MRPNLQIEDANNGKSEHANGSGADQMVMASSGMTKEELKDILIPAVQQVMRPIVENLIQEVVIPAVQQVVREEISLAPEKFSACHNCEKFCYRNSNETTASRTRGSELKFLDEVSDSVLTGKEIKGKGGNHIKVALVDNVTGRPVDSGSEASAKVEIFLEVGQDNNADSIGRENDKTKPHFPKPVHVSLKQGIGFLSNVKLGHGSRWIRSCKCRLGARFVGKFDGSSVKEAWTESFKVLDSRSEWNKKHHPPSLDDDVWRLDNIGKGGVPCNRLHKENVTKVKDFLFLLSIDPQRLQKIVGAGDKNWERTVNHALECKNNDREMRVYCSSSSESINGVVFDVLVHLKGVLRYNRFVPIEYANEAEKAEAKKLLASAFENQKDITLYKDETSLLHKYPCILNEGNATNSSGLDGPDDCNRSIIGNINRHDPTQPGSSSQGCKNAEYSYGWIPEILGDIPIDSFDYDYDYDYDYDFGYDDHIMISDMMITSQYPRISNNSNATNSAGLDGPDDCNCSIGNIDRHDPTQPGTSSHGINPSIAEIDHIESHYDQRSIAGSNRFIAVAAVAFVRLFIRTRVMVESYGDSQVEKRQRHH